MKRPTKKPAGKAKPKSAVTAPAGGEKPGEDIPTQEQALALIASLIPGVALPDLGRVLADVQSLERHFAATPAALDDGKIEWIQVVMTACRNMLAGKAIALGCTTAIGVIHAQTCYGIEALNYLSKDEKSREALERKAADNTVWPVMLSRKEISRNAARDHLEAIGLGAISDTGFTRLASTLRFKIQACIDLLTYTHSTPNWLAIQNAHLPEAKKWEQKFPGLRAFPPLSRETCDLWWPVAAEMLKAYWNAVPAARDAVFKSVSRSAKEDVKTPEFYATRAVKRAFYAMAKNAQP